MQYTARAGAAAVTGSLDPGISEAELDGARRLVKRVAWLAIKLKDAPTIAVIRMWAWSSSRS